VPGVFVNVRDAPYNATGDGVTDDTVAIQAAMDYVVGLGGGTVFFPHGIYLCNGTFHIYWKSILVIAGLSAGSDSPRTLQLLGENTPTWQVVAGGVQNYQYISTIKTTRTDGMTADSSGYAAIIAGSQPKGNGTVDYNTSNPILVKIKNMHFQCPDDPTMGGIRLDGVGWAIVEDTIVYAGGSAPTHGTTGVWMPNCINWSISYMNRVVSGSGFEHGFKVGEHTTAPWIQAWACRNGVTFLDGVYPSKLKIQLGNCVEGITFLGYHPVDLLVETEHAPSGWNTALHDIKDPSNKGIGIVKYFIGQGGAGNATIAAAVDGGTGLTLIDLNSGNTRMNTSYGAAGAGSTLTAANLTATTSTAGTAYIGTDARLVAISGGVKLEVRNTGTGTWVEATRYTNP
jgi:hypothetical protein